MKKLVVISYAELIQGYYHFFLIGKYLNTSLVTGMVENNNYNIGEFDLQKLDILLKKIKDGKNEKNVFSVLLENSAFRGVFSNMRELLESSAHFRNFIRNYFDEEYFQFEQIIKFLRNIYVHSDGVTIIVRQKEFEGQLKYLQLENNVNIIFNPQQYDCKIVINFGKIKNGSHLEDYVAKDLLYKLVHICYDISQKYILDLRARKIS